ncbi:MAG: CAP domain-containing protein [Actinomycetota bacterium]
MLLIGTTIGALVIGAAPMTSATSSTIDGLATPESPAPAVRLAPPEKPEPKPEVQALSPDFQRHLELLNGERSRRGLPPFAYNEQLGQAAQAHSVDQANRRLMTHTGSDGSNPGDRIRRTGFQFRNWAENVAFGYGSVDAVVVAWMNSPGHAANILSSNTHVGFGLAYSVDGLPYWTEVFATPRS